ncbi:hypothetical protein GUJ93_ZPchr0012g20850 [Zizania palustris]|uniref:Uncharacterized protein n=1 Tax=Zizania palustris TaxID=103762 RepID=A0A8J5WR62_ZIZPA|nr:hypothetical protein GUJ93_ZPchr0012g20850 [Zizania palustris]
MDNATFTISPAITHTSAHEQPTRSSTGGAEGVSVRCGVAGPEDACTVRSTVTSAYGGAEGVDAVGAEGGTGCRPWCGMRTGEGESGSTAQRQSWRHGSMRWLHVEGRRRLHTEGRQW